MYRVRESHLPRFGFTVSRADVANFMVKAVEDRFAIHKIIGISQHVLLCACPFMHVIDQQRRLEVIFEEQLLPPGGRPSLAGFRR